MQAYTIKGFVTILQANNQTELDCYCFLYILYTMRKRKRHYMNPRRGKRSPIPLPLVFHMLYHDRHTIIISQDKYLYVSVFAAHMTWSSCFGALVSIIIIFRAI